MLKPTSIKYIALDGAAGLADELTAIDVNGDGYLDIVVANGFNTTEDDALPVFTFINDRKGSLDLNKKLVSAETIAPREMIVADFNGDGINDIFIADQGYDAPPFPGYTNTLLLGKARGGFTDGSSTLPDLPDFTHSADAADIDGDRDIDLFVGNLGGGEKAPYILLNDGSARFTKLTGSLPVDVLSGDFSFTTSLSSMSTPMATRTFSLAETERCINSS